MDHKDQEHRLDLVDLGYQHHLVDRVGQLHRFYRLYHSRVDHVDQGYPSYQVHREQTYLVDLVHHVHLENPLDLAYQLDHRYQVDLVHHVDLQNLVDLQHQLHQVDLGDLEDLAYRMDLIVALGM